jgi:hypothetical protein
MAVGSGDLLGHEIIITQNSLANQNARKSKAAALARGAKPARAKLGLTNLNALISNLSAKTLAKWPNVES